MKQSADRNGSGCEVPGGPLAVAVESAVAVAVGSAGAVAVESAVAA